MLPFTSRMMGFTAVPLGLAAMMEFGVCVVILLLNSNLHQVGSRVNPSNGLSVPPKLHALEVSGCRSGLPSVTMVTREFSTPVHGAPCEMGQSLTALPVAELANLWNRDGAMKEVP